MAVDLYLPVTVIYALMMHMCYVLLPVIGSPQSSLSSVFMYAFPSAHVGYMSSTVLIRRSHRKWHPSWVLTRSHVFVQVENMTNKHHVYMTKDGRISLAGLNKAKSEYLAKAIDDSVRNC